MKLVSASALILSTILFLLGTGCATMTYRSGDNVLETWPRRAKGTFQGIHVEVALPMVANGLSTESDIHSDPPRHAFRLGPAEFVFLQVSESTTHVTVNSVTLGDLPVGDSVSLEADGTILVNGGARVYHSPDSWPDEQPD